MHSDTHRVTRRLAPAARSLTMFVSALLLCQGLSLADTHYVSKSGSNTFPYTSWATASDTVARAVEAASIRDTIRIGPGHFVTDTVHMKVGQVLAGSGKDSTILDTLPQLPQLILQISDSCVVRDLTFIGDFTSTTNISTSELRYKIAPISSSILGGIILGDQDEAFTVCGVRFRSTRFAIYTINNDFSNAGRDCSVDSCEFIRFHTAVLGPNSSLSVRNSLFYFDQDGETGISVDYGSLRAENCRMYGRRTASGLNNTRGVRTIFVEPITINNCLFFSDMLGTALDLNRELFPDSVQNCLIENNTIIGWNGHLQIDRPGFVARNNLFSRANAGSIFQMALSASSYNLTWDIQPWDSGIVKAGDTIPNDIVGNHDNFDAFPMFVDTLDFLYQQYSPGIDAGDPSILDADGSRSDIGYAGGPGGFNYVHPNLPPAAPLGLQGLSVNSQVNLLWRPSREADLSKYRLFRSLIPFPVPDLQYLIDSLIVDTIFVDSAVSSDSTYYYRLTAIDSSGLESTLSGTVVISASSVPDGDDAILPQHFQLNHPYPNPFNAATKIKIIVNNPGHLRIEVFDIRGALIATIFDRQVQPNTYTWTWNPKTLPTGMYLLRARMAGETQVRKLLLMK